MVQEHAEQTLENEKLELLKNIEPPWSWIHQFASLNTEDKSYNFLEDFRSIPSDCTPTESSDESFDFDRGEFLVEESSTDSSCNENIKNLLAADSDSNQSVSSQQDMFQEEIFINKQLSKIIDVLKESESDGTIYIKDMKSILSIIASKEAIDPHEFNYKAIRKCLQKAEDNNILFNNVEELSVYLKREFGINSSKLIVEEVNEDGQSKRSDNIITENDSIDTAKSLITEETKEVSSTVPTVSTDPNALTSIFERCDIEIDEKVAEKVIPDKMIIGLVDTSSEETIIPIESIHETPHPTTHDTTSGKLSDRSSMEDIISVASTKPSIKKIPPSPVVPFSCSVEPLRGIGKPVSTSTIQNFLTYIKSRSRTEKGYVFPRFFKEANCPNMLDSNV